MITVALPKGALLHSIRLLQTVGLDSAFLNLANRQLSDSRTPAPERKLCRAQDVPVYVEYGQAQLGIVGYDVLREKKHQVAHLVDVWALSAVDRSEKV